MKALVLEGIDSPFIYKEVDNPVIKENEVLIKIKAAALNHRDLWIQKGKYAGLKFPIILGSDGAGIVTKIGKLVDPSFLNREVIINPGQQWGQNKNFQSKDFKILGLPDNGTFAEFVSVPAKYVFPKPAHLSFEEAAALPLAGLTAFRALFSRGQLQEGEKVLITGIGGGVALYAMQFALAHGAMVYVTSSSDSKIELAKNLGVKAGVNYTKEDWQSQLMSETDGFDLIIDSAAGKDFNNLIEIAAPGGRLVFYGATQGTITEIDPRKVFWKQLSILGSTMGNPNEFEAMVAYINKTKIRPSIKAFEVGKANEAFKLMDQKGQMGKIVLKISD